MNILSCIVIDDEPLAVQLMESYVRKTPFLDLKGSFTNGKEAFAFIQENPVDLMFCDIQMPDLSGIDLSKMIPEETKVIFTTAFSQYAIEGFKVHALDYLLKPISYDDFLASAKHALKTLTTDISGQPSGPGRVHSRFAAAEYGLSPEAAPEAPLRLSTAGGQGPLRHDQVEDRQDGRKIRSIFVKTEYRLQQIELDKITFIEGFKDYVRIHLDDGSDPILTLTRMKTLEEELPADSFVRVQKSYIVRLSKIEAIERSFILIGKDRIPIGDSYQESLITALGGNSILPK